MNEEKILIILNGEDKTKEIQQFEETDKIVQIKFQSSAKKYPYDKKMLLLRKKRN